MRPFHFAVLFWGDRYREHYFIGCWLRSMMAEGNLPLLDARDGHKIIVATTPDDWSLLRRDPLVVEASKHAAFRWIEIDHPGYENDDEIRTKAILHQHKWMTVLLRQTHDPGAIGSVWSPDQIVSTNMVRHMLGWVDYYDVAICPVLRHAEEPLLEEIGDNRALTSREIAGLTVRHLHRELDCYIEPVHSKMTHAPYRIWRMPGDGMLVHTFFGLPIFMDYRLVSSDYREGNIDTCLRTGNFTNARHLHVVADSDEVCILSLTPKDYKNYIDFGQEKPDIYSSQFNMRQAWRFFADDWVRRQMWRTPVRWHPADIDRAWLDKETKIERQIASAIDDNWFNYMRFELPPQLSNIKLRAKETAARALGRLP